MFKKVMDIFKVKDVRHRMLYVLLCLIIIRLGSQIPVPGVNRNYFSEWFASQTGDAFNFFDAFTGGSFSSMSILALSITPYITSSIIVQLLTIAIPALEEMQRDGEDGFFIPYVDRRADHGKGYRKRHLHGASHQYPLQSAV